METDDIARLESVARNLEERKLDANILCAKCRNGHVFRRRGQLTLTVRCSIGGLGDVPPDIVECTDFEAKNKLDMWEMTKLALVIDARIGIHDGSYR